MMEDTDQEESVISVELTDSDAESDQDFDSFSHAIHHDHPSQQIGWELLDASQKRAALIDFKRSICRQRTAKRRKQLKDELDSECYDWSLKPRPKSQVVENMSLGIGNIFPTRQHFQLRVAEVCNALNKVPRWVSKDCDPVHQKAGIYSGYACARSWSPTDNFVAKATRKINVDGWIVRQVDLSHGSRRSSLNEDRHRKCPFTAKQLAPIIIPFIRDEPSMSAKQIRNHLAEYVHLDYVTSGMAQLIREEARLVVFGDPSVNITYMQRLIDEAVISGHKAKLTTVSRTEAKENSREDGRK